jgi:hypothetical protein
MVQGQEEVKGTEQILFFEQMLEKGGLEAMLHELLNIKITSNLRRPSETKALVDQRVQSLEGVQRWV